MSKLIAPLGVLAGAAVWFLLFVILGTGLGTAFIAGGSVAFAGLLAAAMAFPGAISDAPLSAPGLLLGIAAFVIMRVVLSVPLWIDVASGLGVMGLYGMLEAAVRPRAAAEAQVESQPSFAPAATAHAHNGHDRGRAPVGAH